MSLCNVKVKYLRKEGKYNNLREFMEDENNIYIGRSGRVKIDDYIFGYKQSIWHNPYKIENNDREDCLRKYKRYIIKKIYEEKMYSELENLEGKCLGCWCCPELCHGDIILLILKKYKKHGKKFIKNKYIKF